jgi:tetratricopeptide (TPR) repeat protein
MSIDDKSSDALALLSAVDLTQRKYDEAVATGKKCIAQDPNNSENHAIVAITMENAGDADTGISLIKQAMRLDPYFPAWYWMRLGACYRILGRYEGSASALEKLLERAKKRGTMQERPYLYLATTYSMMGRNEEAQSLVSKALEINPKMTAELWRKRLQYKDPAYTKRILDALRKAGLK